MYTKKMNPRIFLSKHSCHDSIPSAAYDRQPTHTLPSLCLRSGFALPSLPMWESKGIQIGKKHHSFLHVFYNVFFIENISYKK